MVNSKTASEIDEFKEKENLKKIEAILFVSGRFLNLSEIVSLTDLNPIIIRELIDKLSEKYENDDSALEIVQQNDMWKMNVRQEYEYLINRLATGSSEFSKAEQETLAIIAFKQPIKQSVITKIRGNKSYDHIKKFSDLNLIKKKKDGHTFILSLSDDFYDYFNVQDSQNGNEALRKVGKEMENKEKNVNENKIEDNENPGENIGEGGV